jgi:hypothetical protein
MLRYNTLSNASGRGAFGREDGLSNLNSSFNSILNLARGRINTSQNNSIRVETVTSPSIETSVIIDDTAPQPIGSANSINSMSPIDQCSPSNLTTPYSTQLNAYNSLFTDAFEYTDPSNIPHTSVVMAPTIATINTKAKKTLDDSTEIDFEPQGASTTNNTSEEMSGIETIRALFHLFGEIIHDVKIAWFLSMRKVDTEDVVWLSMLPAKHLYEHMKTSDIILHGYRRYGETYIDRRFIELYTILRQICT